MSIIMLAGVVLVSCKKDDPDPEPTPAPVEDGIYVVGAGTALTDFDIKGMFKNTPNEIAQDVPRPSLQGIFVAVKAGAEGFNIWTVEGTTQKSWGPGADFAVVPEADRIADEPKVDFRVGSLVESTTPFTVDQDGLYHVVIDTELGKVSIVPVSYWGVIGGATPFSWNDDTQLPLNSGFNLESMSFEQTGIIMTKGDFKFRYSGGWKVVLDTAVVINEEKKGVNFNTNFGGTVADLVPGGSNIANETGGIYTAKMTWTLGSGYVANVNKTGDLQVVDYTNTELGLVGDGLIVDGAPHNWETTIMVQTPTVENETKYIWMYEGVEVSTDGSFKIREGQNWDGLSYGFPQVEMAGLAAALFEANGDGNFVPLENGIFDIKFEINAVTDSYTFTVNPAGAAPEMFMLGDGCAAGWDNETALPMSKVSDGVYTLTTTLNGTGTFIKFITTFGQWAPMYGTDENATSTSGNLVYRETESDPDPANIPAPEAAGDFVVTMNINDMTYTIAAK